MIGCALSLNSKEPDSPGPSHALYALRLAARENQASEKSISDLQMILADMATKADVEDSERLARAVQRPRGR